jgi:2-oxoglutarate dehydrogenase E2 component (dihydrolipoamide succinyltransferase)
VTDIRIPRLNSNDDTYVLVEWLVADGVRVTSGQPVAVVETSKAAEELIAEADGYLLHIAAVGTEYVIGELIGVQFASEAERSAYVAAPVAAGAPVESYVVTEAARALVERHAITPQQLAALGKKVIKSGDIEELLAPAEYPGARQQRAVAAIVTEAHREIPAAYTVMRVYVDAALTVGRLPELFVKALGVSHRNFPAFFADGGDVGVTIDVGTGLFIPVVRAPATCALPDIAATLMEHRKKAFRRAFKADDLAGSGDIVLSLSHEPDVVLAQAIIFPQHRCILTLGGVLDELHLTEAGTVANRQYVHIGLSFDHRVINGRDAVLFLRHVKELMEDPGRLA